MINVVRGRGFKNNNIKEPRPGQKDNLTLG